ncbi:MULTISPECIES: D-aminoacyl-tRNA deacylase [Mammaliicoccus]|uniref:D-aminoacyl-tRNA deacylase n=1 Tax=Mammaliicoccus fleurettii TaxID=150056 RepID=A0ABS5MRQ3_9STAP|nr:MULTISPECIES: D-aminoacyl-tRNA deacylase [Mammaliicoccus]HCN61454.1 D-tyrosyl-tRNA(Tyr) deacylase [Staphylococcus sp.]MBL0847640.1 D-tyrosyl-tRNA(Tyr) deacylase [Mammaliicoccus fleurettii]MBS3672871.1 D-tyrosyl-tRNA(Tyr) deacylase [Mammaliicoccus fleurettii]MBS3697912.1 D-tyrosyl-tRNA(Tyr) deacylase [Mammaliicoccus fleurettii]MBW0764204.1 D-tyrosyl-tRNA(Tyr) deacylase [Mammaliicoccus fleurettii]
MKVVLQKVSQAKVTSDNTQNAINKGFLLLVGVGEESTYKDAEVLAKKIAKTRIFEDSDGKMNLDIHQVEGEILSISQFTIYASVKKGNRPGFSNAKSPDEALKIYEYFNEQLEAYNIKVKTGEFGAHMEVALTNDGPITIIFESKDGNIQ